jgi:hypothetical protein
LPFNGSECVVYHEFQDQSCSWWTQEIFKISIVDIMFKNPQFDMKAFMLLNIISVTLQTLAIWGPSQLNAMKIVKEHKFTSAHITHFVR